MPRPEDSILQNLLSLKLALRVMSNDTKNVFSKGWYIEQNTPKFMLKASKLLMLRSQSSILQHLLPEAGPEDIKKYQ